MNDSIKTTSAVALAASGTTAAFGLAACCAIPFILAGVGMSAPWLGPLVSASQPHAAMLTAFSLAALIGSVAIAWRAPRHCRPNSICARPAFRWSVTIAAILGAALLALSKIYA